MCRYGGGGRHHACTISPKAADFLRHADRSAGGHVRGQGAQEGRRCRLAAVPVRASLVASVLVARALDSLHRIPTAVWQGPPCR